MIRDNCLARSKTISSLTSGISRWATLIGTNLDEFAHPVGLTPDVDLAPTWSGRSNWNQSATTGASRGHPQVPDAVTIMFRQCRSSAASFDDVNTTLSDFAPIESSIDDVLALIKQAPGALCKRAGDEDTEELVQVREKEEEKGSKNRARGLRQRAEASEVVREHNATETTWRRGQRRREQAQRGARSGVGE